jgi:hypothetical protein
MLLHLSCYTLKYLVMCNCARHSMPIDAVPFDFVSTYLVLDHNREISHRVAAVITLAWLEVLVASQSEADRFQSFEFKTSVGYPSSHLQRYHLSVNSASSYIIPWSHVLLQMLIF